MEVKIKRLSEEAILPKYSKDGDAGMDLTCIDEPEVKQVGSDLSIIYHTGLCIEIPTGYVGLLFPRSSLRNKALVLSNHVGVIDSGYRGEITASFKYFDQAGYTQSDLIKEIEDDLIAPNNEEIFYHKGDRIIQLLIIPYPQIEFIEVDELSTSERGGGGHGSTGK